MHGSRIICALRALNASVPGMRKRQLDTDPTSVAIHTQNSGVQIRCMIKEDLSTVTVIEEESFSTPWTRSTFLSLLKQPSACLFSAVDSNECIIGYAAVWFVGDEGELGDLAVDNRVRRNGVCSLLLHAVVEEGRKRALHRLFLEVRESNDGAQSLYSRHGFEIVGSRRNYYTNPVEDAVLMQFLLIR